MRRLAITVLLFMAAVAFPVCVHSQTYTTITSSDFLVDNGSGTAVNPPAGSALCFLGVNSTGSAITYTPSGGSPVTGTVCQTLTSGGALTGTLQVANPATASPNGLYYTITVTYSGTTYITIPSVSLSGYVFAADTMTLPGTGTALGIGGPHLACALGAQWTSTTYPLGQQNALCNASGTWALSTYCPLGTAYNVPQSGGTPFCLAPELNGLGAPTGSCTNNSTYLQPTGAQWICANGAWAAVGGGGGGGTPTCTANQMTYYAANGDVQACLNVGSGLSIAGGTITSSGGGGSYVPLTGNAALTGPITGPSFGQPTFVPNVEYSIGDSITYGTAASKPSNVWHTQLANYLGISTANHTIQGYGGDQMCDTANRYVFPNYTPINTLPQPLTTLLLSTNDLIQILDGNMGTLASYLPYISTCQNALVTWMGVTSQTKTMGSTATMTGSCTTDTTYTANEGFTCNTSGSTATMSLTTTGGPVYIWYRLIYGDSGTGTYAIDGGSAVSFATSLPQRTHNMIAGNNAAQTVAVLRITGLAAGVHSFVFTQTSGSGTMDVVAVGTPTTIPLQDLPPIIEGDTPSLGQGAGVCCGGNYPATIAALRSTIQSNIQQAFGDGINVTLAPVSTNFQAVSNANPYDLNTDGTHPLDPGEDEIFQAYMSAMKFANIPNPDQYNIPVTKAIPAGSGTVTTNGTTCSVNWASGSYFSVSTAQTSWTGQPITINGSAYTISSMTSNILMCVTPIPPALTGVAYSVVPISPILGTDQEVITNGGGTFAFQAFSNYTPGQQVQLFNYDAALISPITNVASSPWNLVTAIPPKSGCIFNFYSSGAGWLPLGCYTAGGTLSMGYRQVASGNTTVTVTDQFLNVAGGGTVTFPSTGITNGNWVTVMNYDTGNVETISTPAGSANTIFALNPRCGATFYYVSSGGGWSGFAQSCAGSAHSLSLPVSCVAASGSSTTYTCSTSLPFTLTAGDRINFNADVTNTGTATINVNGHGAQYFRKQGGTAALAAGDLQAGQWIGAYYDGTYWQLEGQLGNAGGGGGLSGMTQYGIPVAATASTVTNSIQPASWTTGHTFVPVWQPSGSALAPVVVDANTLTVSAASTATSATTAGSLTGALSANQLLGSLTAVAPTGQGVPSCSTASSALLWTSGTGFSCNTSITANTASTATTATNATNVATTTQSASATYYPVFVPANSSANQAVSVGPMTYNPNTGLLTTTGFSGALTGNASGTAANVTGIVLGANGGTGVANTGSTLTLGASLTTTGTGAPTLAFPATTSYTYTFPAYTGTLIQETASDTTTSHVFHASATGGVGTFGAIAAGDIPAAAIPAVPTTVSSGSIGTLTGNYNVVICTSTCNLTPVQAAAGIEVCVRNAPGSATVITLNALASSNYYELTTHAGWGTAAHNLVSGGAATDSICLHGYDATHYAVMSYTGTWTD